MAIPPRGDPRRPLHSAVQTMTWLAVIFLLLGLFGLTRAIGGPFSGAVIVAVDFALFLGPGTLYLLGALHLERRKRWAIVVGLIAASTHLLEAVAVVASVAAQIWLGSKSDPAIGGALVICPFIVLFASLVCTLSRCFEAIKYPPLVQQRGFEPVIRELPPPPRPEDSHGDSGASA